MKTKLSSILASFVLLAAAACDSDPATEGGEPLATFSSGLTTAEDGIAEIDHGMQMNDAAPMHTGLADLHAGRDAMHRAMEAMIGARGCMHGSAAVETCGPAAGQWQAGHPDMDAGLAALDAAMVHMGASPGDADGEDLRRGMDLCRQAIERMQRAWTGMNAAACGCRHGMDGGHRMGGDGAAGTPGEMMGGDDEPGDDHEPGGTMGDGSGHHDGMMGGGQR